MPTSTKSAASNRKPSARPTRISWAWVTLIVGVILGIALVDFLAQNTRTVRIEFFSASGNVPIVVALLVAALAGAAIALLVGGARIGQLRRRLHGTHPRGSRSTSAPGDTVGTHDKASPAAAEPPRAAHTSS